MFLSDVFLIDLFPLPQSFFHSSAFFFVTLKQIFDIYVMHYFPFFINNVYVAFVVVHQKSQCEKKLQCAINIWSRGSTFNQNTHSESSVVRHMHFVWEIYWFFNLSICLLIRQNQWWWQQWLLMMKVVVQHSGAGLYVSYCAMCRSSSTC